MTVFISLPFPLQICSQIAENVGYVEYTVPVRRYLVRLLIILIY